MDDKHRQQALGRNFRKALDRSGMTAAELADTLGVRAQTVGNWKNRGVSVREAYKVAELLGVGASAIADLEETARGAPPVKLGPTEAGVSFVMSDVERVPEEPPKRSKEDLLKALLDANLSPADIETLYQLIRRLDN